MSPTEGTPIPGFCALRDARPRCGNAADKCDRFPSPHGFARAEDHVGYQKHITFWIENCAVRYAKAGRPHGRFGSKTHPNSLDQGRFWGKADMDNLDFHVWA